MSEDQTFYGQPTKAEKRYYEAVPCEKELPDKAGLYVVTDFDGFAIKDYDPDFSAKWFDDKAERTGLCGNTHWLREVPALSNSVPLEVVEKMAEALKEAVEYLNATTFKKGQPIRLNNIGGDSILHRQMAEALAEYQSLKNTTNEKAF